MLLVTQGRPPAAAAVASPTPGAFALSPVGTASSISLHGKRGRVLEGAVVLRNVSGHRITVILQRADIRNSSNGDADYVTTGLSGTGRWFHLSAGKVRLGPHASRQVAYRVRVPTTAAGGSHYGGIVAVNAADFSTASARRNAKGRKFTFYRISRQALPLTIHLRGRLSRRLSLRSVKLVVAPIGAGLVLRLVPGGNELTERARLKLRVLRGQHRVLASASTLGQLFPGGSLDFRVPWAGRPTQGTYHVLGTIRPQGAAIIYINQMIRFTGALATRLSRDTPPAPQKSSRQHPGMDVDRAWRGRCPADHAANRRLEGRPSSRPTRSSFAEPLTMRFRGILSVVTVGWLVALGPVATGARAALGPAPLALGAADGFAVMGGSTVTSVGVSAITGDLGVSPGTAVTGFGPGTIDGALRAGDATAAQAHTDLATAYTDAVGRARRHGSWGTSAASRSMGERWPATVP